MQFSSRQILIAVSVVAFAFGILLWLRKMNAIDPSSESVWIAGERVAVSWQDHEWRDTTGVYLPATQFGSGNWNGQGSVAVHQPLLTISYKNYFGQEVFLGNVYLQGQRTEDWSAYLINVMRSGGGIVDAGTIVTCEQSQGSLSLKLVVTQYLNSKRVARRREFIFDRIGNEFIPRIGEGFL